MCFCYLPRERRKVLLASLGPLAALRTEGSTRTPVFIVTATQKGRSVPPRAGSGVAMVLTLPACSVGPIHFVYTQSRWDSHLLSEMGGWVGEPGRGWEAPFPPPSHSRGGGLSESLQRKAQGTGGGDSPWGRQDLWSWPSLWPLAQLHV